MYNQQGCLEEKQQLASVLVGARSHLLPYCDTGNIFILYSCNIYTWSNMLLLADLYLPHIALNFYLDIANSRISYFTGVKYNSHLTH